MRPDKVVLKRKRSASAFQIFNPIQNPFTPLRERSHKKKSFFFQIEKFRDENIFKKILKEIENLEKKSKTEFKEVMQNIKTIIVDEDNQSTVVPTQEINEQVKEISTHNYNPPIGW